MYNVINYEKIYDIKKEMKENEINENDFFLKYKNYWEFVIFNIE